MNQPIATTKSLTGQLGEQIAVDALRSAGCLIVERNWRSGRYETDIIALENETLLFVEVKTRSANRWSDPEDAITPSKVRSMKRSAAAYLAATRSCRDIRFDLAAVLLRPDGTQELRYTRNIAESHW